jgi:hypothetical protein
MIKRLRISFVLGMFLVALFTMNWTGIASAHTTTKAAPAATSQPRAPMAACYDTAFSFGPFTLNANTVYEWPGGAPWFVTTSNCADININFSQLTHPIQMQVCFIRTNSCNSWKTVSQTGTWYQIATSVLDGTSYRFGIKTTSTTTIKGEIAD